MKELSFRVTSFDPHKTSDALVSELVEEMLPEVNEHLRHKWSLPELMLEADRRKSIPIDPATAYLVVKVIGWGAVTGATAIAAGFLQRLGEDIYEYVKARIKNGSIESPQAPPSQSPPAPQLPKTFG